MEKLFNYTIAYKGHKLFDGNVRELIKTFDITFNEGDENISAHWMSERFEMSDDCSLQDFIEAILHKINHDKDELDFCEETLHDMTMDCETEEEYEEMKADILKGDFSAWLGLYFCYRGVDNYFAKRNEDIFDTSSSLPNNFDWKTNKWIGDKEYV